MAMIDLPLEQLPEELAEALGYWRGMDGETLQCAWREFDLMRLPISVIPSTMVIDIGPTMDDNRYRFWGSHMTAIRGKDLTGKNPYHDIDQVKAAELRKHHKNAIETSAASASKYSFKWDSGVTHQHSTLRLPLSNDGQHVHHLVICIYISDDGPGHFHGIMFNKMT